MGTFDGAPRVEILKSLREREGEDKLLETIKSLYSETRNCVKVAQPEITRIRNKTSTTNIKSAALHVYIDEIIKESIREAKWTTVGYKNMNEV